MIIAIVILCLVAVIAIAGAVVSVRAARADARRHLAEENRLRAAVESETARRMSAFDHLPVAALRVDAAGYIGEINALARQKFPHVEIGGSLLSSFGEHRLADEVAAAHADGATRGFELRLFADERRTFRVTAQPLEGATDREVLVFLVDFTDAVAYQELRSQFSANVSHELRTPLTGLAGLVEALGDVDIDPETHARFVDRAASEIQRLVALITDVLFLSELEATNWDEPAARTDARVAIDNAVEALGDVAVEHGVAVVVETDGPVWMPLTERMATTVIQNLVENAVKYGGPGSVTTVGAHTVDNGRWAEIVCSDTGPGIPERHLAHIFERFYRADASRSKRLGGTGLGLSIVKHIAERFGGGAEASSREGFGTTVTVRLPVPPPDTATPVPVPGNEDVSPAPTR